MRSHQTNWPLSCFTLLLLFATKTLAAQNINGEKVIIGKESITIINFPDKVLNINFSDDDAYEYYIPKRREERSISLQFNKEKNNGPGTSLLVNEGGRSHMFRVVFDSTYNINDDTRPPLWYDHSDLKELKAFVQRQKEIASKPQDDALAKKLAEDEQRKEAEKRKEEYAAAQEKREQEMAAKAKLAEQQAREDNAKQKEQAATLVKAQKEAEEKEKQLKLAAENEAKAKKLAEEKSQREAEEFARQKAAEEQKLKLLKEQQAAEADAKEKKLKELKAQQAAEAAAKEQKMKELQAKKDAEALAKARQEKELQDKQAAEALARAQKEKELQDKQAAEALAKAQREAEEKKRLQEEKLAKQKALEEEKRRKAEEELAKKEAEKKAAQERLARLEAEKKEKERLKAYSEAGIWERYGKKGINVYDVPAGHMGTVISDFYIARDTLRNFIISDSVMKNDAPDKLNIEAGGLVNKGVKITLENIAFKDLHSYYKLKIENNTNEDFLMGKTYMYWYDKNDKPIKMIKSSYITYVTVFPLVRPKTTQYAVFVTRSPNVADGESLVLFVDERRKDIPGTSIVISSDAYNKELKKVQQDVKVSSASGASTISQKSSDSKDSKKSRKKK